MSSAAEGFDAGLYNPALLGLGQSASLTMFGVSLQGGTAPLGLGYLGKFGPRLDLDDKAQILAKIEEHGSLDFHLGANVHWLGISSGKLAINILSEGRASGSFSPRLAELALYGNVSPDGVVRDVDIDGTVLHGRATTKAAVSYGTRLGMPVPGELLVGATLNAGVLNGLAIGRDRGSRVLYDPLSADGVADLIVAKKGEVYSVDLGAGWDLGPLRLGAALRGAARWQNIVMNEVEIYRASSHIATDTSYSRVDTLSVQDLELADQEEVERLLGRSLSMRSLVVSGAYDMGDLLATAELRFRSPELRPDKDVQEIALGAIWRPLGWLHFRGGTVFGTDVDAASGGVTLSLGPLALDVAASKPISDAETYRLAAQMSIRP